MCVRIKRLESTVKRTKRSISLFGRRESNEEHYKKNLHRPISLSCLHCFSLIKICIDKCITCKCLFNAYILFFPLLFYVLHITALFFYVLLMGSAYCIICCQRLYTIVSCFLIFADPLDGVFFFLLSLMYFNK